MTTDLKDAFITAIKNNEGLIYKIASVYTNDREDRDDLVQEIIYQLWKSFPSFKQQSGLTTWMYRVAMNTAIYHLKVSKRKVPTVPIEDRVFNFSEEGDGGLEEKWKILRQHLNGLNLLDRGIVLLYLEAKTYEEIAEITGISTSNVGTKLNRIKEKLKNEINKS